MAAGKGLQLQAPKRVPLPIAVALEARDLTPFTPTLEIP
jgi:hypothetical protein